MIKLMLLIHEHANILQTSTDYNILYLVHKLGIFNYICLTSLCSRYICIVFLKTTPASLIICVFCQWCHLNCVLYDCMHATSHALF